MLGADVVLLQEADKRLAPRWPAIDRMLLAQETDFELVETAPNGLSIGWHGNAVLVRKCAKISGVRRLAFPGLEPRGAVCIDMDIGSGLCIVAAHLGLLRRDRRKQFAAMCQATRQSNHTVLAGDFNEWSMTKGMEPLAARFDVHAPGLSFHARRPVAALDRFALSRGLELRGGGVEEGALARRASDHLPIWVDIDVPAYCAAGPSDARLTNVAGISVASG